MLRDSDEDDAQESTRVRTGTQSRPRAFSFTPCTAARNGSIRVENIYNIRQEDQNNQASNSPVFLPVSHPIPSLTPPLLRSIGIMAVSVLFCIVMLAVGGNGAGHVRSFPPFHSLRLLNLSIRLLTAALMITTTTSYPTPHPKPSPAQACCLCSHSLS
jgi:hypothetical protein